MFGERATRASWCHQAPLGKTEETLALCRKATWAPSTLTAALELMLRGCAMQDHSHHREGPGSPVPPVTSLQAREGGSIFSPPPPCGWVCWQGTKILPAGSFLLPSFLLSGRCLPPDRVLPRWPWGGFQNKTSFFCPWQIAVFIYSEVLHSALVHMGFEIRKWSSSSQLKLLRSGKGAAQGAWIPPKKDNKPLKSFSFAQPSDWCAIHGPWG